MISEMKTKQQLLSELFLSCIELNDDNFTVFCGHHGHINQIDIAVHKFGWKSGSDPDFYDAFYTEFCADDEPDLNNIQEIINHLRNMKSESAAERERLASDAEYKKKKRKEELLKELEQLNA